MIDGWSGGLNQRTAQRNLEFYEGPGNAVAKLFVSNETLIASVIAHEIGHNLGFDHTKPGCGFLEGVRVTILAENSCEDDIAVSLEWERDNWELAYWADAVVPALLPTTSTGCFAYNWFQSGVHNERYFDTWHFDGGATFVRSDPKNAGSINGGGAQCGQMPGPRTYHTYSVTNAHSYYFGGNIAYNITIPGTLPQITSLVPYGSQTMVISWNNSNPAGSDVHIEMSVTGPSGPWQEVATDTVSPYTHGGRSPGVRYWYRVRSHSHTGGGFSSYSPIVDNYTPPDVPTALGGTFNVDGNPNKVSSCFTGMYGATSYTLFFYKAGSGSSVTYNVTPNSACYGSVLYTVTRTAEVYHIAVKACNPGGCSAYRDMSGSYWWWIPCSTGTGCPAGGSPDPGGHGH